MDILEEDYNILLSAGIDTGIEDIDMLEQCYEKDATSITPNYILKVSVLIVCKYNPLVMINYICVFLKRDSH